MNTMTHGEFLAEARSRFGDSVPDWRFVCPKCGTAQSVRELRDAVRAAGGTDDDVEGYIAFSCIGRFTVDRGCDWTLGGLFRIHTLEVVMPDGTKRPTFELAESPDDETPEEGTCPDCDRGDEPKLLDSDGVRCDVSGRPGSLCHAADEYWWPCKAMPPAPDGGGTNWE